MGSNKGQAFQILEGHGDHLVVSLNRPDTRNSIDGQVIEELHALCDRLEREPQILILTGTEVNGKGIFASGADIGALRQRRRDDALQGINNTAFQRLSQVPAPVIAAIDGYALGGGLELALAADFRVATNRTKFGQPEVGLGIIAAAGGLWRLKAAVGETLAREILMAGRILTADEALDAHLISQVTEPEELLTQAVALADKIAAQDPLAVRLTKQLINMPAEAHPQVSNLAQAITFESEAKYTRMDAFLNKKK
ncbi:enoyl-CoA hydratase/isomerase family protein [Corynebacterium sp. S7]